MQNVQHDKRSVQCRETVAITSYLRTQSNVLAVDRNQHGLNMRKSDKQISTGKYIYVHIARN